MGSTARKIGVALRRLRMARGLSQEQLAERAKVTQAYISAIEGRQRVSPSLDVLERLARALRVRVADLLR